VRAVRSAVVVEALPHGELLLQIHIVFVGQELVELVFVDSMRAREFAVELWRSWFDVGVFHALVCNVPAEERLELVAAIGSDRLDPERELVHDVVDIERQSRDPKAPPCHVYAPMALGVVKNSLFPLDLPLFVGHPHPLGRCLPSLWQDVR
jgi:hypothetical protein